MIYNRGLVIYSEEISSYWNELLLNSRLNVLGIHPAGGLTDGKAVDDAIAHLNTKRVQLLLHKLTMEGIDIEHEVHALSWLLPRKLFSEHPDWFRMNEKQERVNDFNFCAFNKDALSYISKRSADLAQIFIPTTNRYHFWLDDVVDCKCHCRECASLSASDYALIAYNTILKGIKTINPHACQCYLAYHDTLNVPKVVEPEPGIFLEYAPMDRDLTRPIADKMSEKNAGQIKPLDDLLHFFGTKNAKVLDYWMDNSYPSGWKKPMKSFILEKEIVKKDINYYQNKGFETITSFACYLGEEYYQLYHKLPDITSYCDAFPK